MAYISSVGQGIPKYHMTQEQVKTLVQEIFPLPKTEMEKLLPVFDHAEIYERQLVVDENWFKETHTFEEKNHLYQKHALSYSLQAIDHCLTNEIFLEKEIPHDA